jgi:hypothetical protein
VAAGGRGGVVDVTTYGATPGSGDSTAAIQAAVNAACAMTGPYTGPPPVYLPPGQYFTSQPITAQCKGFEMFGACREGSVLVPGFGGPAFAASPPDTAIPLGPALVGTGSAAITSVASWYLNLRDIPAVELDGLTAFTAEAYFEQTAPYEPGFAGIVGSLGGLDSETLMPSSNAFSLGVSIQTLTAALTVGGTRYAVTGTTVPLNTVQHAAITYDGTMIRLFQNGALVASQAATGRVAQTFNEVVAIGPVMYSFEASAEDAALPGSIDSVRLSDVARYTAPFTPAGAKLADDASTLALVNWDGQANGLTLAYSRGSPFWLPMRSTIDAAGDALDFGGGPTLHDFSVQGGMGFFSWLMIGSSLHDLACNGCDYGFAALGNNYLGWYSDLVATAGTSRGRTGLSVEVGNGNVFRNVSLTGQVVPFVLDGAAEDLVEGLSITAGPSTVYGALLISTSTVIDGITLDASGAASAYRGGIGALTPWAKLEVERGTIGNAPGGIPIVLDGPPGSGAAGVLVQETSFTGTASAPEVIHLAGVTAYPDVVLGATKDSATPWSDDPSLVTLPTDPATLPLLAAIPPFTAAPPPVQGTIAADLVFDITAYGATPTANDNATSVQAAVNAACQTPGGVVYVPPGYFNVGSPIAVTCDGLAVYGAGELSAAFSSAGATPAFTVYPASMTGLDVAPSLFGAGDAMQTDGASYWIELTDSTASNVAGLGAFTVEAQLQLASASPGYAGIVQSYGCLGSGAGGLPGCTSAFSLATEDGVLTASLTSATATVTLSGPAMPSGGVHHVALSWDGATARLFLDGALEASEPLTSTLAQGPAEDVTIGPRTVGFDAAASDAAVDGVIDTVRLSGVARYTAAFTAPTTRLAADDQTLVMMDFEAESGIATKGWTSTEGPSFFPVRRTAEPDGTPEATVRGFTLRGMTLSGRMGVFGMYAVGATFEEVYCGGIVLDGSSAGSVFSSVDVLSSTRYGIATVGGDGNLYVDVNSSYPSLPFVAAGGAGQVFHELFVTPDSSYSLYGLVLAGASGTLQGLYFDTEGASDVFYGDVVITDPPGPVQITKGEIDLWSTGGVPITIENGQGLLVMGTSFGQSESAPELVHVIAPTAGTNEAVGVTFATGATLSDDPTFVSVGN